MLRTLAVVLFGVFTSFSGTVQAAMCFFAKAYPNVGTFGGIEAAANLYGLHFDRQAAYLVAKGDAMGALRADILANLAAQHPANECVLVSLHAIDAPYINASNTGTWIAKSVTNGAPGGVCRDAANQPKETYPHIVKVDGLNPPLVASTSNGFSAAFVTRFNETCMGTGQCSIRLSGPGGTNGALADVEPGKVVSGLRAEVTCDGVPSDKAVTLTVEANANTGGHNHHDSARPPGALNPASGNSPVTFSFTAPAPAGDHTVTAKCADGSCGEDTGKVWVGVKDLAPLSGLSGDYRLVGDDLVHPGNSHLSSQASPVISNIAGLYKIVTQFDAPPTPVLHLNDASLERGGLFDIQYSGRGTTWWTAPHSTHRFGVEIDVRANPKVNPGTAIPETNFGDFEFVVARFNATRCPPGPGPGYMRTDNQHYHVCLMGGNCCQGGNR